MSIVQSLLFGTEGNYQVAGIPVAFEKGDQAMISTSDHWLVTSVRTCLESQAFRVLNQSYIQIFVHEMGHAATGRLLVNDQPHIHIFNNQFGGVTQYAYHSDIEWKNSAVTLAGPLTSMIFSCIKLAAAVLVNKHISKGASYLLGGSAAIWMLGELIYTFTAGLGIAGGDFYHINNPIHLTIALAAMVSTCALGIFTSIKLHRHVNT